MRRLLWSLALFLVLGSPAWAEFYVCFDRTRDLGQQFYVYPSVDPSELTDPNCHEVSDAHLDATRLLVALRIRDREPMRYLKIVGGQAVEMLEAEKDALDAFERLQRDEAQVWVDEINLQPLCSARDFTVLHTRVNVLRTQIASHLAAMSDSPTIIAELAPSFTIVMQAVEDAFRCILARSRVIRR